MSFQIGQTGTITGVVKNLKFGRTYSSVTTLKIFCAGANKYFDAFYQFVCPLREGDTITAYVRYSECGAFQLLRLPFLQPTIDSKTSIVQCFMRVLKCGFGPAAKIYNSFDKLAGGSENVISCISELAQEWSDNRKEEILFKVSAETDEVSKLLSWWHKERNIRRLYLFGLTKKEINACRMTCQEIFERCIDNPYTVPGIPLEKCDIILEITGKKCEPNLRLRGSIIRVVWNNLHKSAWTCTPNRLLAKQFPDLREHYNDLVANYGVNSQYECIYLNFPLKVEKFVADFIERLRLSDYVKYDTPVDTIVHCDDGTMIERKSAFFTRDDLSEDQKKAIQGALDHTICVITSGAGTGKCLAAGTKVLLFNGETSNVEDVKVGDLLMGPDSKPRKVLSICTGTDNMFEIKPDKGRSFVCNSPHVLTLKGIKPYITENNKVIMTIKGIIKEVSFSTPSECKQFIDNLEEDIFDIQLDEFLNRPSDQQKYSYLFRVPVEFSYPSFNLPVDPYTMGLWLSSQKNNKNMYVPDLYKYNLRSVRLSFLAGFIDSESDVFDNRIEVSISNCKMSDDLEYISFSLGFMVISNKNNLVIYGKGVNEIPSLTVQKHYNPDLDDDRANHHSFTVHPKGRDKYYGFQIDGDGRFLLSDFLVTHNTTCLGQILHNLELQEIPYAVCSFTGKAVSRIREVTKKRNAATIHRLISNSKKTLLDKRPTKYEKELPLSEFEHVVIDEASMVTTELLYDFLVAHPNIKKLTLIGDYNQLIPIEWGSMFSEIIKSQTVPTYRLTTNFRVKSVDGQTDGIILNANELINHNPNYPFEFIKTSNFDIHEGGIERVFDIITACYKAGIKANQLVVLTPYVRHLDPVNKEFQRIYDDGNRYVVDSRGTKWIIGDNVMLIENDIEIGVYNGESGIIKDVNDDYITVEFPNAGCHDFILEPSRVRDYYYQGVSFSSRNTDTVYDGDEGEIDQRSVLKLAHSYCLTIDKSQGSEWDYVIVFIPEFNTGRFLNRNRIYTAITRTKRCCWCVVADEQLFNEVSIRSPPYRCENLAKRLAEKLPNLQPFTLNKFGTPLPGFEDDEIPDDAFPDYEFDMDDY